MSSFKEFTEPKVSIDKISIVINFLPLIDRQHAYQFLRKTKMIDLNRFDNGTIADMMEIDWIGNICELFQTLILDNRDLSIGSGSFRQSAKYQYAIQIPLGIHLEFMRNKNARVLESIELYGPYRIQDTIKYHTIYETYDTASQIRVEWNPNNTDISILSQFFEFISYAPGFDPLNDIKITRLDTAVDVPHDIDMSMITSIKSVDQSTFSDRAGGLTKYIGSRSSDRFIRVYNKKIEMLKKTKIEHENKYFYRYESVRQKGKGFYLFDDKKALEDCFDTLAIIDTKKIINCDDLLIKAYYDIARLTDSHFDAVVNENMKGCERKKIWRLKKKFREFKIQETIHPSIIYNEQFGKVWSAFKSNFISLFRR